MKKKILFTYNYGKERFNRAEELGYEIIVKPEKGVIYSEDLKDVEIMVTYNPFDTLDISFMKDLKWIQALSVGFDQIPKKIVSQNNIIVTNNRFIYNIPIAEWVIGKILELYKNTAVFYKHQQNKIWKMDHSLLELAGKTVGIIGTGSIAAETAKRLKAFDTKVIGVNRDGRPIEYFDECFSIDKIHLMLKLSHIVVCLIPGTSDTYHIINEDAFKAMKDGVTFINVSRGMVVDEKALINNLTNGKVRAAALDVVEKEPLEKDNPLWDFQNVIITPHNAWVAESNDDKLYSLIYENLVRYKDGQTLKNIVDLEKGY
jgi:phosphoglycerate dehydrogenase-like enzyme